MTTTMAALRSARAFLAMVTALLLTAGCSLGIGPDRVEEFPMLIIVQIRGEDVARGELLEGRWTSATELRFGAVDAAALGVSERIELNSQERAPGIWLDLETDWLVNDINTNPEFCLEQAVVLVDESQRSEHVIAEPGQCFQRHMAFEFSADIHPGE